MEPFGKGFAARLRADFGEFRKGINRYLGIKMRGLPGMFSPVYQERAL